jgi:hypothetical protein
VTGEPAKYVVRRPADSFFMRVVASLLFNPSWRVRIALGYSTSA